MTITVEEFANRLERRLTEQVDSPRITPNWLSVADAAAYSGIAEKTIRKLLAAGKLVGRRPVPGRIVISRIELDGYINGCIAK